MKTLSVNEIANVAKRIADEREENISFLVRGNIIEGCRNRKGSETYEFDAKKKRVLFDDTRNQSASSIIDQAIDLLAGDCKYTVEFTEEDNVAEVAEEHISSKSTTISTNFDPYKSYFLRFTADAIGDMAVGVSLFKVGSMDNPIELKGLCGFKIDFVGISKENIESIVDKYSKMFPYYSGGADAAIFEGEYVDVNKNDEGVIFKPNFLVGYVKF